MKQFQAAWVGLILVGFISGCGQPQETVDVQALVDAKIDERMEAVQKQTSTLLTRITEVETANRNLKTEIEALKKAGGVDTNLEVQVAAVMDDEIQAMITNHLSRTVANGQDLNNLFATTFSQQMAAYEAQKEAEAEAEREQRRQEWEERRQQEMEQRFARLSEDLGFVLIMCLSSLSAV